MINTYLADDHKVFCDGLERLLTDSGHFHVIRKFHDGKSLLESFALRPSELLVMDIEMPGMNGLDIIKRVHFYDPHVKIAMLSMHDENIFVQEACLSGAVAYINKSVSGELLIQSLLSVCKGERIFPSLTMFRTAKSPLSQREQEILKLIARGKTSENISEALSISHLTVKTHRRNMIRKLQAKNSSELITKAIEKGIL